MNSNIIIGIVLLILFVLLITTTILLFKKVNHTVKIVLYIVCGVLVLGAIISFSIKSSNNSSGGGGSTTVPDPPTITSVQAGGGQATVTFTAPTNTGGSPIQTYTVTSSPGNIKNSATSSPIIISGLTNGTAYTFTVTATNSYGTSLSSSPSSVTLFGAPDPPTITLVQAGYKQVAVTFTAPTNTGGLPIQTYTVNSSPGDITNSGTSSPIIVSGLTSGISYKFFITATNSYGTGRSSSPSSNVTPFSAPDPPTITSVQAGDKQTVVTFNPPTNTGGLPIQTYTVTSSPGNITNSDISNSIIVSGLTNGTAYTFTVKATNSYGPSLSSSPSSSVTPFGAPDPPTITVVQAGNKQAAVIFTAPTNNGGIPIQTYTVTSSPDNKSNSGTSSPIIVSGLTNGTAYTFTVTATNSYGPSLSSSTSYSVTPFSASDPPTNILAQAGNGKATVTFTAPINTGGSPIQTYTVTSSPGNITNSDISNSIIVSGLTNGTAYTFTVTATNSYGPSLSSNPSSSVTPFSAQDPPTITLVQAGYERVTVSFTAPTVLVGSPNQTYIVTSSPGNRTNSGTSSPIIVDGLTNGTPYTFTVSTINSDGIILLSSPSSSVTPFSLPDPPRNISVQAGYQQVTVTFTAPTYTGESPIQTYTVTSSPGNITKSGTSSPITITGLTSGTAYTFTVKAMNRGGHYSNNSETTAQIAPI